MKKYNNIANHMNFAIALMNVISPIMIIFFATKKQSIDTIVPMIVFTCIMIIGNFVYFHLLDHWYFTYYNEQYILQKWFKKRKKIDFDKVKYMYFVGNLVILSEKNFSISTQAIKMKTRRKIIRALRNEICIIINVYDKTFPKMILGKCVNVVKIDLGVKVKIYREMFKLDAKDDLE